MKKLIITESKREQVEYNRGTIRCSGSGFMIDFSGTASTHAEGLYYINI